MLLSLKNVLFLKNIIFIDPLSQFEVVNALNLGLIYLTNLSVFIIIIMTGMQIFFVFSLGNGFSNVFNFLTFALLRLVNSIINDNTALKRKQYFSVVFYLFMFILFSNMIGLLPFSWSITNSFVITFYLAFTYFFGINLVAIWRRGWDYCKLFLPSGVPIVLAPLIVVIEVVSYYSRVLSLSIRLFANISSGHALLKILTGFSWGIASSVFTGAYGFKVITVLIGFLVPWLVVTLIFFLEFLIAFLQSYVFVILISIYINDVSNADH